MAATATALGAAPILLISKIEAKLQAVLLGFSAGIMLAASFFSLLLPGLETAQAQGFSHEQSFLLVATALAAGAAILLLMDRALPHTHVPGSDHRSITVWLFVFAIAVHNIPEGLAIGVAAALADGGEAVAIGISLQNMPEGLIIAVALLVAGYSRWFSFTIAALSGVIEPIAALVGTCMVSISAALLPWGLAGAAGAMIFVISHEIIPESHRRGHETLATTGLMCGFVLMMLLDAGLA